MRSALVFGFVLCAARAAAEPGDVMLENGTKINVKDMRQLRKLLPNIQIR